MELAVKKRIFSGSVSMSLSVTFPKRKQGKFVLCDMGIQIQIAVPLILCVQLY